MVDWVRHELWTFGGNRIFSALEYESRDTSGQLRRSHRKSTDNGPMRRRDANDHKFHGQEWCIGVAAAAAGMRIL